MRAEDDTITTSNALTIATCWRRRNCCCYIAASSGQIVHYTRRISLITVYTFIRSAQLITASCGNMGRHNIHVSLQKWACVYSIPARAKLTGVGVYCTVMHKLRLDLCTCFRGWNVKLIIHKYCRIITVDQAGNALLVQWPHDALRHLCSLNCSVAVQLCLSPLNTDLLL